MGMTPLEGLPGRTRVGDIDSSVIIYLLKYLKLKPSELEDYLNFRSGFLGFSGKSGDTRDLLKLQRSGDKIAELVLQNYRILYRLRHSSPIMLQNLPTLLSNIL